MFLVGGTQYNELYDVNEAQKLLCDTNYTVIANFTSPEALEKYHDVLSANLNKVYYSPFSPDDFGARDFYTLFDSEFADRIDRTDSADENDYDVEQ